MAENSESGRGEYTKDGTVDLKGNPVLRSKRGGWTACSFVVVYEAFERMAYYGISSNLVLYLTDKLHQGTVASANNVTNWLGAVWLTPIVGAYVADAHLGRYWTFAIASVIYLSVKLPRPSIVSLSLLAKKAIDTYITRSISTHHNSSSSYMHNRPDFRVNGSFSFVDTKLED
ncbi:hypothetical protein B296_00046440 [Ensete ventricosum]|uniref:Major facilitator superfamily (MFS) profile domain-containing protein n=1 Tax=Ensete ventricosum TaxID=4639 RepID=A0A426XIT2_ENSVE|nr:hypothetical protein B296_00046440 [Ensete ventricosum]